MIKWRVLRYAKAHRRSRCPRKGPRDVEFESLITAKLIIAMESVSGWPWPDGRQVDFYQRRLREAGRPPKKEAKNWKSCF